MIDGIGVGGRGAAVIKHGAATVGRVALEATAQNDRGGGIVEERTSVGGGVFFEGAGSDFGQRIVLVGKCSAVGCIVVTEAAVIQDWRGAIVVEAASSGGSVGDELAFGKDWRGCLNRSNPSVLRCGIGLKDARSEERLGGVSMRVAPPSREASLLVKEQEVRLGLEELQERAAPLGAELFSNWQDWREGLEEAGM